MSNIEYNLSLLTLEQLQFLKKFIEIDLYELDILDEEQECNYNGLIYITEYDTYKIDSNISVELLNKFILQLSNPNYKKMQWKRENCNTGQLFLYIFEDGIWKNYKITKFYTADAKLSSNSGFATAQKYLKMGYSYVHK